MTAATMEEEGQFGSEPSVFLFAVKKLKNWNIQDDNFDCRSVWV
jgi:hypothetical protein